MTGNGEHKVEETVNNVPIKNDKLSKEENKQSEGEENNKHFRATPQCYDTPWLHIITSYNTQCCSNNRLGY